MLKPNTQYFCMINIIKWTILVTLVSFETYLEGLIFSRIQTQAIIFSPSAEWIKNHLELAWIRVRAVFCIIFHIISNNLRYHTVKNNNDILQ